MTPEIRIESDKRADALYIALGDRKVSYSKELTPDIIVDYDAHGGVVGFDIQHITPVVHEMQGKQKMKAKGTTEPLSIVVRVEAV